MGKTAAGFFTSWMTNQQCQGAAGKNA